MYRLNGTFELRTDLGVLRRINGDEIDLRPKTFQTLLFLVRHRHRLVTKDELTAHLWSETAVTDDALVQCIVEARKALGDDARDPKFIKTVPKLGYRFVGPVEEFAAPEPVPPTPVISAGEPVPATAVSPRQTLVWPIAVAVSVVLGSGAVLFMNFSTRTETAALDPTSGKPGIAVMFLDNQSQTEEIDWMRQGLAEMLITGLSRSDRVNVLGRKHLQTLLNRSHHEPDQEISIETARDVARRSQAQYLLMGSFARLGDKTRIDVHIETIDARRVASETLTLDRPEDVLTQVDMLAWKLARHFDSGVEQPAADMSASGLTNNLDAYRAYSLGLSKAIAYHSEEAVKLFERALELDPNFVMARARLGYVRGVTWPQADRGLKHLAEAFAQVDRLRERDRLYIEAWHAMARSDFQGAIAPLERLVRLYPYEVEAYDRLARLLQGQRRLDEAIDVARRGLLIDPESPDLNNTLGGAYAVAGRSADAIAAHRRYVALAPDESNSYDSLGLSFQAAGRYDEAEQAFMRALELHPDFEVAIAHLANVRYQTGRYRSAVQLYEQYVARGRSAADRARGYNAISIIRQRHGRTAEATQAATQTDIENRIFNPREQAWGLLTLRALQRQSLGTVPAAESYGMSARGSRHSKRYYYWMAGQDALARGDVAAGLESMRLALSELPIYWSIDPAEDALAMAHYDLGRWDEAIAEFGRVLQSNPRYPRAHYYLARAYERKGDKAATVNALKLFLSIWSAADDDIPEMIDAKARLAKLQS